MFPLVTLFYTLSVALLLLFLPLLLLPSFPNTTRESVRVTDSIRVCVSIRIRIITY